MAEYLKFRGFEVHVACDGAEAIATARKVRPRIVLMDLSMPGIDGWHAARVLKSDPELHDITVIALTAHAFQTETEKAIDAGCDGVICKPFDVAALADALPRVLTHGPAALNIAGLSLNPSPTKNRRPLR